jgi:subfamily B ATP-binding cassette protein MsbA
MSIEMKFSFVKEERWMRKTKTNSAIRILSYIVPHWHLVMASTIAGVVKLSMPLILPQVIGYFTDELLVSTYMSNTEKVNEILKWLIILLGVYVLIYIPAAFIRQAGSIEVANRIMNKMRCELFEHLQLMSAEFHNNNRSGSLVTRINSDVEQVHEFIWGVVTNIWIDGITIIIYIVLLCRINVFLTIVACFALPVSVIATKRIRKRISQNSRKARKGLSDISGYMQERMSGFSVVKLFGMEKFENDKFKEYSDKIYKYNRNTNRFFSLGEAMTSSFSEVICSVIVCLSAILIVKDRMTIGEMIIFETYIAYFITPIKRFAELNVTYSKSIAGIERVFDIFDIKPEIHEKEDALNFSEKESVRIAFQNVNFKYDKTASEYILKDISFSIEPEEKVALVGSSGCGKSTIINLLARFYDIDSGKISFGNRDLYDYSMASIYNQMGIVFQETILFSGTIEENVRYGKINATMQELEKAAEAANAIDFIKNFPDGWNTMIGERGTGLSGGQKQRISIARVFLKNPKLLILDEATSALDSESETQVQDALDNLMKRRTTIIIAHRLSTIVNADKIIVMDKGKIVEIGTHEQLLQLNGRYKELYDMQFRNVM